MGSFQPLLGWDPSNPMWCGILPTPVMWPASVLAHYISPTRCMLSDALPACSQHMVGLVCFKQEVEQGGGCGAQRKWKGDLLLPHSACVPPPRGHAARMLAAGLGPPCRLCRLIVLSLPEAFMWERKEEEKLHCPVCVWALRDTSFRETYLDF